MFKFIYKRQLAELKLAQELVKKMMKENEELKNKIIKTLQEEEERLKAKEDQLSKDRRELLEKLEKDKQKNFNECLKNSKILEKYNLNQEYWIFSKGTFIIWPPTPVKAKIDRIVYAKGEFELTFWGCDIYALNDVYNTEKEAIKAYNKRLEDHYKRWIIKKD